MKKNKNNKTKRKHARPIAKKIRYTVHPRKFGYDVSVHPHVSTDAGGGGRESGVTEEYVIAR